MPLQVYPDKYKIYNNQTTKTPVIVVQIDGIDLLTNVPLYTKIRYGDPNLVYTNSDPDVVYGGLRRVSDSRDLISFEGSQLTISQKVEPEQGRASISMMTVAFIDKDGYMSQVISPGVIVDDILGKRVRIYLGYQSTSFPEDFFTIFRGYVTAVSSGPGLVTFQFSDANAKKRTEVFKTETSLLTGDIDDTTLTIPVVKTDGFYDHILGPDGSYDDSITTYLLIDEEYMKYSPGALTDTVVTVDERGSRNTTPAAHDSDTDVQAVIEIEGNPIDIILKMMLSGWEGPYVEDVAIKSFVQTDDEIGALNNAVVLNGYDAIEDLGISVGDYITITGSANSNDKTTVVTDILDLTGDIPNRILLCEDTFNLESPPTSAVLSVRSQFDTFPSKASVKLDPIDVDVRTHVTVKNNYLSQDTLRFFIKDTENAKSWMEKNVHLIESTYPVSRYGRISITITRPPLSGVKIPILDKDTILNPNQIMVQRAINNRKFFNEVRYDYNKADNDVFITRKIFFDADSLNTIGFSSVLPIEAPGVRTNLQGELLLDRRGNFLLSRYKDGCIEIQLKTNFMVGSVIEIGDVVLLKDNGDLQITNFETGNRDLGDSLFEVIERSIEIKSGEITLKLISNLGYKINDRIATISPSSLVASATDSYVIIEESFGEIFPGQEFNKWVDYVGLKVHIHSFDYTNSDTVTFLGFDPTNSRKMLLSPALNFTPVAGDIVDISDYPDNTDTQDQALYKLIHNFVDPTVDVVTGISGTQFTVSAPDALKFFVGSPILIHSEDYSVFSDEVFVTDITGTTITVDEDLGFTPAAGQFVELIGFPDGGGPYRIG